MIVTTSPSVEGRPIDRYLGVVSSQAIMGTHIGKDLKAGFRSIVGGRSKSYEGEIAKAVADVIDELKVGAEQIGGDAVVSIDIDYESVGNSMLMVAASGTASSAKSRTPRWGLERWEEPSAHETRGHFSRGDSPGRTSLGAPNDAPVLPAGGYRDGDTRPSQGRRVWVFLSCSAWKRGEKWDRSRLTLTLTLAFPELSVGRLFGGFLA